MSSVVAHQAGDVIFAIDRHVEPVIEEAIEQWPEECRPLLLIAEGMGEDGRRLFGEGEPRYRLIIDPIDGTRNIMYDMRSAWFLASLVPNVGEETRLKDAVVSVVVELPTSKHGFADSFTATIERPTLARRCDLRTGQSAPLFIRPSTAATLKNGFAQVSNFFPGTKVLASELMERIAARTLGPTEPGRSDVFDDQYLTTGGQMIELAVGRYRFTCDLRPAFYKIVETRLGRAVHGLECHPYDLAGALVAKQAGVILTDAHGKPLDAPLDVTTGVAWAGYANAALQHQIEPVIQDFLREHGV